MKGAEEQGIHRPSGTQSAVEGTSPSLGSSVTGDNSLGRSNVRSRMLHLGNGLSRTAQMVVYLSCITHCKPSQQDSLIAL